MSATDEKERVDHAVHAKSTTESEKDVDVSDSSDPANPSDGSTKVVEAAEATTETEYEYVTGVKLWLATAAVTLVCFLMMLDMSIIVTVSLRHTMHNFGFTDQHKGHSSHYHRFSFAQ